MFEDNFWAENGFDELRRLMKQGSDFLKEVSVIMNERSDIEKMYSKNLAQLSKKARKASTLCVGSLSEVWQKYCESLEYESELHKTLSQQLVESCSGPIKVFVDDNMRKRKPLEQAVDKHKKAYLDRYSDQLKCKRGSHLKCRELEQVLDQLDASRNRTEKEVTKLEKASKKSEESFVKADREYKDSNIKTEEARLAWESSMYTCCRHLERLEHSRLEQITDSLKKYCDLMLTLVKPLQETCDGINDLADLISADRDIEYLCQQNGTGPNNPEQLLLDTYEDDLNNHMDAERRAASLDKKIQELETDIDRKEKEKKGVLSLSQAYGENPDFTSEKGAADVDRQIIEANAMLNMLKANHFKLLKARSDVSSNPGPDSPYIEYIQTRRDKQGQIMNVLCVPIHQISELEEQTELPSWTPPQPTGSKKTKAKVEEPPPAYTPQVDEFDDGGATQEDYQYISRCEVLYDYEPQAEDELKIFPGDTIYVTEKIDDSWWQGNLNGTLGLFPATYVEEVEIY